MNRSGHQQKLGIIGGGQLGRMLVQSALDFSIPVSVLDPDPQAPCSFLSTFRQGSITEYSSVLDFGMQCDVITIEIEHVNTQALKELVKLGKKVFPQPEIIELIKDKRTQKQFYTKNNIPTSEYILIENKKDVELQKQFLPAVQKTGLDGYDGRGVEILKTESDISKAFDVPGFLEKLVDIEKEIAVLVARNEKGEIVSYDPVEMVFHSEKNLVEYLFSPALLNSTIREEVDRIAKKIIEQLGMVGLLAVEFFVTKKNEVLVNEIAPRPHNSGHHTIEANVTSQYEQHVRSILNLPMGNTASRGLSAMVNILGEDGYSGEAVYNGINTALAISDVHVHLYGKQKTKPFRKMGHVTIIGNDFESLMEEVKQIKQKLKVTV